MNNVEIKDYRKLLEKEYMEKDTEIDQVLIYVTIGSLGFFMTINEKFVKIYKADFKLVLIISMVLLFLAFALLLFRKIRNTYYDQILLTTIDNMEPENADDDLKLLDIWNSCNKKLIQIRNSAIGCLGLGVALQVLFMLINLK